VKSSNSVQLHDMIYNHPSSKMHLLRHFGSAAMNGLRIEHGFKINADMNMAHYSEGAISPFVAKKRHFVGRDDDFVPAKMATMFQVGTSDGWEWSVLGDSPIVRKSDHAVVGYVSSSAFGIQTKSTIAMGYVMLEDNDKKGYKALQEGDELLTLSHGFEWPTVILKAPPVEMLGRID